MTIQNLLTVFSPSLKISMTFLKLLVEHHTRIFEDTPTLADRRNKDKRLTLLPDLVLSDAAEDLSSVMPDPSRSSTEKTKFSTPIADKFARGPVEISFREPSPQPPMQ
jgi:hypothetical protein